MKTGFEIELSNEITRQDNAFFVFKSLETCDFDFDSDEQAKVQSAFQAYQTAPKTIIFRSAFDEMMSSGAFVSLKDEKLKADIVDLYTDVDWLDKLMEYWRRDVSLAGRILWEYADFSFYSKDVTGSVGEIDLSLYCDDRLLKNAVWELKDTRTDWIGQAEKILEKIDSLLNQLSTNPILKLENSLEQ